MTLARSAVQTEGEAGNGGDDEAGQQEEDGGAEQRADRLDVEREDL